MQVDRTRRSRCGGRGAALVEAIVVIPFFLIIFGSIVFVGELYSRKLATMSRSTRIACEPAGRCTGGTDSGEPLVNKSSIDLGAAAALPFTQLCDQGFGEVVVTEASSTTAARLLGGFTKDAS